VAGDLDGSAPAAGVKGDPHAAGARRPGSSSLEIFRGTDARQGFADRGQR
jgi:hypothetical protein